MNYTKVRLCATQSHSESMHSPQKTIYETSLDKYICAGCARSNRLGTDLVHVMKVILLCPL